MRLSDSPVNYRLGSLYSVITAFLYATQEPFSFPAARRLNTLQFVCLTQVALLVSIPLLTAPPASPSSSAAVEPASSRWGAFGSVAFTVIWTASVLSNVGTAMFDTASGWLITSLDANPITVSLVQVAVSLPLFLFTLPAGALADVIDSRRLSSHPPATATSTSCQPRIPRPPFSASWSW